jgi:hypothetical protein
MEFIITNLNKKILSTNITDIDLLFEILKCNKESEIIYCPITKKERRQGVYLKNNFLLFLTNYDSNITNKIFKHYFKLFNLLADDIIKSIEVSKSKENQKTRRLKHNLINHNSNILQELYKLFSQEQFKIGANHLDVIQSVINKDSRKAAFAFLKILKNSNLMKAEFDVYEMLDQDNPFLDFTEHPIHKVVILTINPFWLDLIEKKIVIIIQPFSERINIDYKTVSVALSHIFDNATKYIKPYSEFKISFQNYNDYISIKFDMISLMVDEGEIKNIFRENVSGKWAIENDLSGDGIGMFMIEKLTKLNNGNVTFNKNVDVSKKCVYNSLPYENNVIEIKLNKK